MIDKPRKGEASTGSRVEPKLSVTYNFQLLVSLFEFAPLAAIIGASAKAKVAAAPFNILADLPITCTVESATIAQVRSTGKDEKGAGRSPRFFDNGFAFD